MDDKAKKIIVPFMLMLIFNLGLYYLTYGRNFGEGLSPHVGILLISGLLLGPYGAVGSVFGNFLCDLIRGYSPIIAVISAFISFAISYLGYKLWYEPYKSRLTVENPKLNNTNNVILFLAIVLLCGILYSILHGKLFYLIYPETIPINGIIEIRYFLNFINASFIFGIIGIWISNKKNFIHIPKTSESKFNKRFYRILGVLLLSSVIVTLIIDNAAPLNNTIVAGELIATSLILFVYLKKPITEKITINASKSVPEEIMNRFNLTLLFIMIVGALISYDQLIITTIDNLLPWNQHEIMIYVMIFTDIILLIFFIPSMVVLRYIEMKVINPILSFTKIEDFIHENEKIESEGLIDIYSDYINEETEIGTMARSYSDLINFNNNYIENIQKIEGEKERIKAELDIATKIQAANLPTQPIDNDYYTVNGLSKPAKEVGGDFFDYYELDEEHLAIIIGDASGKGVPAAILAMITQVMIKQMLKHDINPSKILYLLNNQLSEHNAESMFITLWLGVYNKTTGRMVFSNGGHNPPLIRENGKFSYLDIDTGIVLGIVEDFDFVNEEIILSDEIVLYTDGITDANNRENEMYGEAKLLNFFDEFKSDADPIKALLSNIDEFTQDTEQFDDMTLMYLKIKN